MSTSNVMDFERLHEDIEAGVAKVPGRLTRQGRGYRRWLKEERKRAQQEELGLSLIHI